MGARWTSDSGLAPWRLGAIILLAGCMLIAQTITTVAGGGQPPREAGAIGAISRVAVDAAGNVYASDVIRHIVWKITASGELTVLAGNGTAGYSGDFGPATQAQLNVPTGLAVDASGNVFVADSSNHRVRKIGPDRSISTVAGNGKGEFSGDGGLAVQGSLQIPHGVAVDGRGNVYIADMYNNRLRKVDTEGKISTVAGTGQSGFGGDGGPAEQAALANPAGVALDKAGNVFIADTDNHRIRRIGSDGKIATVAGTGVHPNDRFRRPAFSGDGGLAVLAHLNQPVSVALDASGNLFIADTGNQRVRKVNTVGVISTLAGIGMGCFSGEGRSAAGASLNEPAGVAVDAQGTLYIADTANQRVRKITAGGDIVTLAGTGGIALTGDGGQATAATLNKPEGVAVDPSTGDLYISDTGNNRVRKVGADGAIHTVAGTGAACFTGDDGLAADSALTRPRGLAVDNSGALYIADGGNSRVRRVDSQGILSRIFGADPRETSADKALIDPRAVALDSDNRVFIAEAGIHWVRQVNIGGSTVIVAKGLKRPSGLAWDPDAGLYIADSENDVVRRLASDGNLITVAGTGARGFSGDGDVAAKAALQVPMGLAVDGAGNLFIADERNHRIRQVTPGGKIATVAGRGSAGFSGDGGPPVKADLSHPSAVAVDAFGNLYIADTQNSRIRKVTMPPSLSAVPASLDLSGVTSRTIRLRASNPALSWEATPSVPWLKLSMTRGAFPATVTVSAESSLPAGEHQGTIEFRSPGAVGLAVSVAVVLRKD